MAKLWGGYYAKREARTLVTSVMGFPFMNSDIREARNEERYQTEENLWWAVSSERKDRDSGRKSTRGRPPKGDSELDTTTMAAPPRI